MRNLAGVAEGVAAGTRIAVGAFEQLRAQEAPEHGGQISGRGLISSVEGKCQVGEGFLYTNIFRRRDAPPPQWVIGSATPR